MKHASAAALHSLSDLLDQIRQMEGMKEKKLGIFYRQSKSFLHFHEDPAGLFADVNVGSDFDRYSVNTKKEWKALLRAIDGVLKESQPEGKYAGRGARPKRNRVRQATK